MGNKKIRKVAGVDYDETSVDFVGPFLHFYNQRHRTSFKKNDINFYGMEKILNISEKEITRELDLFYQSPLLLKLKPLVFAVEGLELLKRTHSPLLITSRPLYIRTNTLRNISLNFPDIYDEIHFVNRREKAPKYSELGITLLIEDDISTAEIAACKEIEVFLLDRRWNRNGIENPLIKRMGNCEENPNCGWKEIIEEMNKRGWN